MYAARIMWGASYATAWAEERVDRIHVGQAAVAGDLEASRRVHPGVDRDHGQRAAEPRQHDRDARPEVHPRPQALPAEDVDRHEDRLEEEEDSLQREGRAEDLAEAAHELGPQEAHLERQHRAGDRADREEHGRHLRPALGEPQGVLVAPAQSYVVGGQDDRGERDAHRGQDDVEAERESHLASRGFEVCG